MHQLTRYDASPISESLSEETKPASAQECDSPQLQDIKECGITPCPAWTSDQNRYFLFVTFGMYIMFLEQYL